MEHHIYSRRCFLHTTVLAPLGAVLGLLATPLSPKPALAREKPTQRQPTKPSTAASSGNHEAPPSMALSLTVLQAQAKQIRRTFPEQLAQFAGMNRLRGFITAPDGELILLGDRDPSFPPIHVDDLCVALRNAYQISPAYQGAPGCSIDVWSGAEDPWRIQRVRIFGMPASTPMAARHVALDYELKKISAGIVAPGDGIPSLYSLARSASPLCSGALDKEQREEATHRYWFYPLYPPPPRFLEDGDTVLIVKPVDVQLLTEQEFLDKTGQRTGSAPASPTAKQFAELITQRLTSNQLPRFAPLANDFRVIEVARLLHFKRVPAERLRYLLHEYPLPEVPVRPFIGGLRREERGEVVCASRITEQWVPDGKQIESQEQLQRYHYTYRGGVEARVTLGPTHFVQERTGALASLRRRVLDSRPSPRALWWPVSA